MKKYRQPFNAAQNKRTMGEFNFTTKVTVAQTVNMIDYSKKILMLGSCFTTEIGKLMQDYKFDVMINPFGVLYNPCSISKSIKRLLNGNNFKNDEIIRTNPTDATSPAKYATFWHHSSFARYTREEFLSNANRLLEQAAGFIKEADTVIITLGTAWVYSLPATGEAVSNCHKRVAKEFSRELLSVESCKKELVDIAMSLPDKNIIFTVSPIRHLKDTAHGNQISKATLLLAIDEVISEFNWCSYFPSYEIMMDELRDYRYYAEDMVHPSPLAVKYIFEKFKEANISPLAFKQMESNMRLTKAENHIQKQIPQQL